MKEHFIILTSWTFQHFYLYWSQFSIAEYMRCQLITTLHFDFSKRFSAVFVMLLNFLQHQNGKKVSSTRKRNYCAFSRCAFAKLKIFHSAEKFLKWTPPLKGTCKIRQCKKCRKKWTMYCIKSVQDCVFVLLINPNGIHTKI